jgi:hypothetical protein
MQIFADTRHALAAGYEVVDYDVELQAYIVEKDETRSHLIAKQDSFAAVFERLRLIA